MNRIIFIVFIFLSPVVIKAQAHSTTQLYAAAVDTVLKTINLTAFDTPILVRGPVFYRKNIKMLSGLRPIKAINGLNENEKSWFGKQLLLLDLNPLTLSKNRIIVMIESNSIHYKSKKRWKLSPFGSQFYYVFFSFDINSNEYDIDEVVIGKFCPDTVN